MWLKAKGREKEGENNDSQSSNARSAELLLSDEGGGGGGDVLPVRGELPGGSVVPGQSVDSALDEDESVLGISVSSVGLQVLSDGHGLLDEHVQVLGDLGGEAVSLEQTEHLVAGDVLDLADAGGVSEHDTDLGRGQALLGQSADEDLHLLGGHVEPRGRGSLVGDTSSGNTLTLAVHSSHG